MRAVPRARWRSACAFEAPGLRTALARLVLFPSPMGNSVHALEVVNHPALSELYGAAEGEAWVSVLPPPIGGRDALLLVADEPIRGAVWELATRAGYDVYACRTPLEVVDTLVGASDGIACVVVESGASWSRGLREFLSDEYPRLQRLILVG